MHPAILLADLAVHPLSAAFGLDETPPGYRWLALHENGVIETGVARLANYSATLDRRSGGY